MNSSLLTISFNLCAYFKQDFFITCINKGLQHCFTLHVKNFMPNLTSLRMDLLRKLAHFISMSL